MPAFSELKNMHYAERAVLRHAEFIQTVEAAVRAVAVDVYTEPANTPGHAQRAHVALVIATSGTEATSEAARFTNLFATVVVQDAKLRGQFFDTTDPGNATRTMESRIRPWLMVEADLRAAIRAAWNVAANVSAT